jgi:hypothetical protein
VSAPTDLSDKIINLIPWSCDPLINSMRVKNNNNKSTRYIQIHDLYNFHCNVVYDLYNFKYMIQSLKTIHHNNGTNNKQQIWPNYQFNQHKYLFHND